MEATYAARNGYPLLLTLNEVIRGIREGGLQLKWSDDLKKIMFLSFGDNDNVVLTFDHLQTAFLLLFIGLTLAAAIFVSECFLDRWNKRKLDIVTRIV